MTTLLTSTNADALAPIRETLAVMAARPDQPSLHGLVPGLTLDHTRGWRSATALTDGSALPDLLRAAKDRWQGTPHAAAALAWKCYSYWASLPAVLGYAVAGRVPILTPDRVLLRWSDRQPFLTLALHRVEVAVLPHDPIALAGPRPGIRVVPDDDALLDTIRATLLDAHLAPIADRMHDRVHIGRRTLLGSVASGVAHGLSRAADVLPGSTLATAQRVLDALDLADLVDVEPRPDGPGLNVQRRTCCLAFTLPEPRVCSGCCIRGA